MPLMMDLSWVACCGYGMDLTNPILRGRRIVMRLAVLLMLIASVLLIISHTDHTYHRQQQPKNIQKRKSRFCESMSPDLGPISVNKAYVDLEELEYYAFPEVTWGGKFSPRDCIAHDKVAIVVPYRDRKRQLPIFLNHMHQFLMKQQMEYGIFIVEQASRHEYFNRGKLLNVGFAENQYAGWKCFIFHDIDLLPLDLRNIYSCPHPKHPRHHAAAVEHLYFKLPYNTMFSGAVAMSLRQFRDVNGFSNTYWGFGGEDDDMAYRMHLMNYTIARYNMSISRYASLDHEPSPQNKNQRFKWYTAMLEAKSALPRDGLSTLNYSLSSIVPHRLYTHITANIGRSPSYHQLLKILNKFKLWRKSNGKPSELDRLMEEFTALL